MPLKFYKKRKWSVGDLNSGGEEARALVTTHGKGDRWDQIIMNYFALREVRTNDVWLREKDQNDDVLALKNPKNNTVLGVWTRDLRVARMYGWLARVMTFWIFTNLPMIFKLLVLLRLDFVLGDFHCVRFVS